MLQPTNGPKPTKMGLPAILPLSQEYHSLEGKMRDYLELVPLVHYPDSSLCVFCRAGLNAQTKAYLLGDDPHENFCECVVVPP